MKTLQIFLKQKFSDSKTSEKKGYGESLAEAQIGRSLGGKSFTVPEAFNIYIEVSVEEIQLAIKEFYLKERYIPTVDRNVNLPHFGTDLSFERGKDRLFVVLSHYTTHFRISVTEISM